jgi:hypothetical protein
MRDEKMPEQVTTILPDRPVYGKEETGKEEVIMR